MVALMGEEEDPAVPAPGQARPKVGPDPEPGPQDEVVRQDKIADVALAIPAGMEREILLNSYKGKPRVSLRMLMFICMLSSYQTATTVSQGRTRAFSLRTGGKRRPTSALLRSLAAADWRPHCPEKEHPPHPDA